MEFYDVLAAGLAVQPIDVLCDQCPVVKDGFQGGDRGMAGVGLAVQQLLAAVVIEFPHALGVALKGLRRGEIFGPATLPEAALPPERGHAAFGGDPSSGQATDTVKRRQALRYSLDDCSRIG